jgi:hypothetical protein
MNKEVQQHLAQCTQHNDIWHKHTQHDSTQHNDTQHNNKKCMLSVVDKPIMLSVMAPTKMLSIKALGKMPLMATFSIRSINNCFIALILGLSLNIVWTLIIYFPSFPFLTKE